MQKREMTSFLGRSMVEMLGVLAIVGVLSVGALAGYSKAMMQYRMNRHTDQISQLFQAVVKNYEAIRNDTTYEWQTLITKTGDIPSDMLRPASTRIYDIFGTVYRVINNRDSGYIGIFGELKEGETAQKACENVYRVAKAWSSEIRSIQMILGAGGSNSPQSYRNSFYGDRYCGDNKKCVADITVSDISGVCDVCDDTDLCRVFVRFK